MSLYYRTAEDLADEEQREHEREYGLPLCPQCDEVVEDCLCEVRVIGGEDLARDILALVGGS